MANEKRLIDANAYCKELYGERDYPGRTQEFMDAIEVAIADLCDMPTVDAVEVVRGRWIEDTYCSNCRWFAEDEEGHIVQSFHNYCPNCGAKMDGDGNE
jgi:hypothetical protein